MKKYTPIILILMIIGCGVAGYFLVWPEYKELTLLKKEFEIKDEQLKEKLKYSSELDVLFTSIEQRSEELAKIDVALPIQPSIAALYYFVKDIDSKSGLKFEDINISSLFINQKKASTTQAIYKMPFSISMSGGYAQFKDFLANLYLNSRIIEIKALSFSVESASKKSAYSFNLELETQKYNPNTQNVVNYQQQEQEAM